MKRNYDLSDPINLSTAVDEVVALLSAMYHAADNTTDEHAANASRSNEILLTLRREHGIKVTREVNERTGRRALHLLITSEDAGVLRDEWIE